MRQCSAAVLLQPDDRSVRARSVSEHMHTLLAELRGEPMPGSRPGANGCHYWLQPATQYAQPGDPLHGVGVLA